MSPTYTVPSDQLRRTPPWLYRACCRAVGVEECALDAFADCDNALCLYWYGGPGVAATSPQAAYDGAAPGVPWYDVTFANPPFRLMAVTVDKALAEAARGVRSILVGPAGCSQAWFHKLWPRARVLLPDRRLVYRDRDGRPTKGAMTDTAVYLVDGQLRARPEVDVLATEDDDGDDDRGT